MVRAEPVGPAWRAEAGADVAAQRVEGGQEVGGQRERQDEEDERSPEEEGAVGEQARQRLGARAARGSGGEEYRRVAHRPALSD